MKLLFALLAITACFASELDYELPEEAPVVLFFKGFLAGIGETKSLEDLKKCLKEAEAIFEKIKHAIELIKTLKIEKVIEGVKLLIEAVKQLLDMIKPCMEGFEQLKKLVQKLAHIDIRKIAMKIITHPGEVIAFITSAIAAFKNKDYEAAGKAIGGLMKLLFLDARFADEEEDTPAVAFMKGFLKGVGENTDPAKLLACVKDFEGIFKDIVEAIQKIISLKPLEMIKGIGMLISAVMKIFEKIEPCIKPYPVLIKLFEAVKNADIGKIFGKIMANPGPIIMDLIDIIKAIQDEEWKRAGKDFGEILYILFLKE